MDEGEDFSLADSFINFDYVPDIPAGSDPTSVGSGSSSHSDRAGDCSIEEGIEKISLVGIEENGNGDVRAEINANGDGSESSESESESATTTSSSTSSSTTTSDEKEELEEGEIVDSDAVDDHDSEDGSKDMMTSWGIVVDDDDDDDNDNEGRPVRSKNELEILPLVPPVNVTLGPHHRVLPVGVVTSILGARVIVEGVEKHDPLNEGSILWMTESRTPLGLIDEIFGPVKNPYYTVRYNSANEVPEGIRGGTLISFVPEFVNLVLNNKDLYKKGYDASGSNDEEVSDEAEFSDDEKEAEYKRMQKKKTKRGINDQNAEKRKNNREKVPPKDGFVPTLPVAPAMPLLGHGHCSPISGMGQGLSGATNVNPPFPPANAGPSLTTSGVWTNGTTLPPANAGPNLITSGVWTNGTTLPLQQSAVLPNGFPTNGVSWYPGKTQFSHQLPVPGIPFQQQLNPSHVFPPATIYPGVQPNIFAQPTYAQGPVNQNQITLGLRSPFPQIQLPINLHSGYISGNQHAPHQFNPRTSADHGRTTFHRGSSKGWRPAK